MASDHLEQIHDWRYASHCSATDISLASLGYTCLFQSRKKSDFFGHLLFFPIAIICNLSFLMVITSLPTRVERGKCIIREYSTGRKKKEKINPLELKIKESDKQE